MKPILDIFKRPYLSPKTLNTKDPAQFAPNAHIAINDALEPSSHSRCNAVRKLSYEVRISIIYLDPGLHATSLEQGT